MVEFERFFRVTSSSKRAPAGKSADEPQSVEGTIDAVDHAMMERCIALAIRAMDHGEYSYAAVVCRNGENCLRVDQFGDARSRRLAPRRDDRHFGSVTSPQPSEPRRLHNLRKRGALRAMLLCLARDTHRPRRVWRTGAAHWRSDTLEHSYRYQAVRHRARSLRATAAGNSLANSGSTTKPCSSGGNLPRRDFFPLAFFGRKNSAAWEAALRRSARLAAVSCATVNRRSSARPAFAPIAGPFLDAGPLLLTT
jgi:hypothetical protein